jgi:hypothetical protein
MPVESPKVDASIPDLRQIRGVTGDLELRVDRQGSNSGLTGELEPLPVHR